MELININNINESSLTNYDVIELLQKLALKVDPSGFNRVYDVIEQLTGNRDFELPNKPFYVVYDNGQNSDANGKTFLVRELENFPHHYFISDGKSHVGGGKLLKKYCTKN